MAEHQSEPLPPSTPPKGLGGTHHRQDGWRKLNLNGSEDITAWSSLETPVNIYARKEEWLEGSRAAAAPQAHSDSEAEQSQDQEIQRAAQTPVCGSGFPES